MRTDPNRGRQALGCEILEDRQLPSATSSLAAGTLSVIGTGNDDIRVVTTSGMLAVYDHTQEIGTYASSSVARLTITTAGGKNTVIVGQDVTQPTSISGGSGTNKFVGGGGTTNLLGGPGNDILFGGTGTTVFDGGGGANELLKVKPTDLVVPGSNNQILRENPAPLDPADPPAQQETLSTSDVTALLQRAAAASSRTDAIIAVVDRNGNILGVRVESGVDPAIASNAQTEVFAVDGAVSLARTGALFANDQGPLTSRTIQFISQSTITQREVQSNPDVPNQNSTLYGPGYVAPIGVGGHFPPGVQNTPQVDLYQIEQTNREGSIVAGQKLKDPYNIDPAYVPAGNGLSFLDSYGVVSGLDPTAQNRGVATLPGGIPIYKNGQVVGGIGVFFPGKTGYATEENSALSAGYDPSKPDLSNIAEWMAVAAVGGFTSTVTPGIPTAPIGTIGGVAVPAGFGLPNGRIDLVGITLPLVGARDGQEGLQDLLALGDAVGRGDPNEGTNLKVDTSGDTILDGAPVPSGWLVLPHSGDGITQAQVEQIIGQGLAAANDIRAAIRLPLGSRAQFVYAVTDLQGNVVGLYRESDATVFSIDVAIAKARNVAYYANPAELQPQDMAPGVPDGTAMTNRTFRYLAEPRFPEGIDGAPPGPFSQLNDGGASTTTGLQVGPALPASAYNSVLGYTSFHPDANFRDPNDPLNQNGVVYFPGSAPLYQDSPTGFGVLIGGFGVSGDGVDQDDVATVAGQVGYTVPANVLRADQTFYDGVRLPYQKYDRNPDG
jgi:uncharacterized protein GlcG (DUF336 family)